MPTLNNNSKILLSSCDIRLQKLFEEVVKTWGCIVVYGHRDAKLQEETFRNGNSSKHYPNSKHNVYPSPAVDIVPYPKKEHTSFGEYKSNACFAGYVQRVAYEQGIDVTWKACINKNDGGENTDIEYFLHFELKDD